MIDKRRLFQPDEAEDQGSFAYVYVNNLEVRLQACVVFPTGTWSCTKLQSEEITTKLIDCATLLSA